MMFGLGIRYLNGWAMAAVEGAEKSRAEWPPHPDRVFMALAAAYFETGEDPAERQALEWLEKLGPPGLHASDQIERSMVTTYVPANDVRTGQTAADTSTSLKELKDAGLALLPEYRVRQSRTFPVAVPHEPVVHLIWQEELPEQYQLPLAALCRKVVRIGHSASFVQMWLAEEPPSPNWVAREGIVPHRLRIPVSGRLAVLESACNAQNVTAYAELRHRAQASRGKARKAVEAEMKERFPDGEPVSRRPDVAPSVGYGAPESPDEVPGTVFDPALIVLRLEGHGPGLSGTLRVTEAMRALVLKHCPTPAPEWLAGHDDSGRPSQHPHLATLPLGFVGREHADGRLLGLGLALPKDLDPAQARQWLSPLVWDEEHDLPRRLRLFDGRWFECEAELEQREAPPYNLRPETWTQPSRIWASVTPYVFDRHYDGADRWRLAEESIKTACERIGLPLALDVVLNQVSWHEGVPAARDFPPMTRKRDGGKCHHIHALLVFHKPVRGPIMIGAGRFRGYGLCRPLQSGGGDG
ncbi:MAG: type I-G CRISPR-associated protein Csb2 [Acidobacteriota bacterium]